MRILCLFLILSFKPLLAEEKIAKVAGDDCTMDITNYTEKKLKERKLVFEKDFKSIKKHLGTKLITYGFVERAILSDDTEVEFTEGGCVHYGYTITFKGKSIVTLKDSEKIDRALKLLRELPPNAIAFTEEILKALEKAKKTKELQWSEGVLSLPCGDPVCELVDKNDGILYMGYSF